MSLENEIVKLRESVEKLIEVFDNKYHDLGEVQHVVEPPETKPQDVVAEPQEEEKVITETPEPIPPVEIVKKVKKTPPRKITGKRASEISQMMIVIMNNLGTQQPLRDLLIEFGIKGVGDLPRSREKEFIQRLEEM